MNSANTLMLATPAQPGSAATFLYRTCSFIARPDAVDACETAIAELVDYVNRCEAGTRFIGSFRDLDAPTRFLIAFVFEDDRAQRLYENCAARERFDAVIRNAAEPGVRVQSWQPGAGL